MTILVLILQPDGCCREQEGCCDPRPIPPAQGLQEDPCQARQGAGEEIQRQGEFLVSFLLLCLVYLLIVATA